MTVPVISEADARLELMRQRAVPLAPLEDGDAFAAAFDRFADAKVVLLGEGTHGTSEFYRARAAITRRLIDRHGFRILAIEGDWPDVAEFDRFVRNRSTWGQQPSFVNFPRWMWRNEEFSALIHDLRQWNLQQDAADRAEIRGLDVYSLTQSQAQVVRYLDQVDPAAAAVARHRYGCLRAYFDEPQRYGAAVQYGADDCEDQVVAQLVDLLQRRHYYSRDAEDYLDAEQNARVVKSAEAYYRAMYRGSVESWNLRDSHMFQTLSRLLQEKGEHAKAVVWAHNSHIGNASATAMGERGEFNIGQLCKEAFGRNCVSIGFGTDRGEVAAADDWGGEVRIKRVLPARPDSWEHQFLQTGIKRSLTHWRDDPELALALGQGRLERAIGVIYRPQSERHSHYFEAHLSQQFDGFVWFEETTAVTPLAGAAPEGAPDTYPFGL